MAAGARRPGYSPVHEAISQLAGVASPTRAVMTAGFVAFGVGVPLYGWALRSLGGWAWASATASGACTVAVAALPLGSSAGGAPHAAAALAGYAFLAATPLLAARDLAARGHAGWARASTMTGALSATALAVSSLGPAHGLWQRLGLTIADAWIVASAISLVVAGQRGPFAPASRQSSCRDHTFACFWGARGGGCSSPTSRTTELDQP